MARQPKYGWVLEALEEAEKAFREAYNNVHGKPFKVVNCMVVPNEKGRLVDVPVYEYPEVVPDVFGWAELKLKANTPKNRAFVNGFKKLGELRDELMREWCLGNWYLSKDGYYGGFRLGLVNHRFSSPDLSRKEAGYRAAREVLERYGLSVWVWSMMD